MRLGQLARKLSLRPSQIIEFLAGNQIRIEEGSNTRLEDEHVAIILREFAPSRIEEIIGEPDENEEAAATLEWEASGSLKRPDTLEIDLKNQVAEESKDDRSLLDVNEIREEMPEVIKVPKIELPGLKILGRIEFPGPKKKEAPQVDAAAVEGPSPQEGSKKPRQERRGGSLPKKGRDQRQSKNPIAQQREKEAREAESKRKSENERKKELRTQHYFKKVKTPGPTKALKIMNDPVEEIASEQTNPPKTQLGRFFKWLTT